MQYKEYPNKSKPVFFYLHGECLSTFSFQQELSELKKDFTIVLPTITGHGSEAQTPFTSIQTIADEILQYIDRHYQGHIHVLAGFSIGGQIAIELLSKRPNLCDYAIIESASVYPVRLHNWSYYASIYTNWLAKKAWFNKFMYYTIFNDAFAYPDYHQNYQQMTKDNIKQILTCSSNYKLPQLENITCEMAILVGQREKKGMKKSANALQKMVPSAQIYMLMNYTFGEFSLAQPNEYIRFVKSFVQKKDLPQRKKAEKKRQQQEGDYMPNWKHLVHKFKAHKQKKDIARTTAS